MSYPPKFEDIVACLRATHRQASTVGPRANSQGQRKKENSEPVNL